MVLNSKSNFFNIRLRFPAFCFLKTKANFFLVLFITVFSFPYCLIAFAEDNQGPMENEKILIEEEGTSDHIGVPEEIETPRAKRIFEDVQLPEGLEIPEGMVYVPDGYFQMGGDVSLAEEEKPAHQVYLKDFLIDRYEVSNKDYEVFLQDTGHQVPKYWYDERFNDPVHPVVGVSWEDAAAYAKWADKRLPTEAEWEKAARGTLGLIWPWGSEREQEFPLSRYLNINGKNDAFEYTSPVDHFILGISPFRVYNMAGNVWEWCQDWYGPDYYKHSQEINPPGAQTGTYKVLRGGSWVNKIYNVKTTKRIRNYPHVKLNTYGFRCAKSIY